jgi:type IV pilus assembly protein PilB
MTRPSATPPRLGNILVERGYITVDQLQKALDEQRKGTGKLLGEILVEQGFCTDDQVVECLATVYGVPYAKLEPRLADPKVVDVLPREYIEKNLVFPLFKIRHTLTVAMCEPTNLFLIDEIRSLTSLEVQVVATSAKDIRRLITTLPDSKTFVIDDIIDDNAQAEVTLIETAIEDISDSTDFAGQSPVIRLVNYII